MDEERQRLPWTSSLCGLRDSSAGSGGYDGNADSSVEWFVVGAEAEFAHGVVADPSGNTLGPFAIGNTVKLRTGLGIAMGRPRGVCGVWLSMDADRQMLNF